MDATRTLCINQHTEADKLPNNVAVLHVSSLERMELHQIMDRLWNLEAIGTREREVKEKQRYPALEQFESAVTCQHDRYVVALPWKHDVSMSNNKKIAQRRLAQVTKRLLSSSHQLMQNYDTAIREYLLSGVAKKVTELTDTVEGPRHMYYMPHHAVIREDRVTTKIRIVLDASSHEVHTKSLNDNLDSGPNRNPDIMTVLLNFRVHSVALVTDVQKAFLQIMIREEDRDALRFLWYETKPQEGKPLPKIEAWRMNRVTFGAAPSTFLFAATLHHHLQWTAKEYPVSS
ncbi:uncharacterized protein LOC135384838 [Ornithodoros turicata]|uniref:uncharacterized protein LOC135384838 n=1 Tax=Ornithodoros turicata TaxID=34597 RepID=UPI003138D5BF